MIKLPFPYFTLGTIVLGFGRGSKELGCATGIYANLDDAAVDRLPASLHQGVYYGWGQLITSTNTTPVYKMVTSIGTNPFYHGEKKTIETHLMHKFPEDFYGEQLKIVLLGELRPMTTFNNAHELIQAIRHDIRSADQMLESDACQEYLNHSFFHQ